jgi:hypothetical protein
MHEINFIDGHYTFDLLVKTMSTHVPEILKHFPTLTSSWKGPEKMSGKTRILLFLRLAKRMGCPVCRGIFPRMARSRGMDENEINEALGGPSGYLSADRAEALSFADAILQAGGELPSSQPKNLPLQQQQQILTFVRLEMVIHSVGLMFLPHRMIQEARK